jgi:predicted ribosome quality control (RQC) complex YloA/Tae2 family protein
LATVPSELEVEGERIELDPTLAAVENAQRYFARYRKARDAVARVPDMLEASRVAERHLEELMALIEVADSMEAIRALRREVAAATGSSVPGPSRTVTRPGAEAPTAGPYQRVALGDSWEALVGLSARGNAAVTFDLARPNDMWLHARGVPGAHVVVRSTTGTRVAPPASVVQRAARLAASHSSARAAAQVDVDYVERKHVRRIPNAPPGLVRYTNEHTLRVSL